MASLTAQRSDAAAKSRFETTAPLDGETRPERPRPAHGAGELIANRYRVDLLLARGGMADVYAATDLELRRGVALKIARTDTGSGTVAADRLLREARLLANLQHPNIAAIHDHGRTAQGTPFLVLELITGTTLRQFLAHCRKLHWRTAVAIAIQTASGLRAAHERGIVHCDLSPSNVLIARDDRGGLFCKLIDFGIADRGQRMRLAPLEGTQPYVAPEGFHLGIADVRLDLYALGGLLTEMIADGTSQTPIALTSLIRSLQATDPDARPSSAAQVIDELRRIAAARRHANTDPATQPASAPTRSAWLAISVTLLVAVGALVSAIALPAFRAPDAAVATSRVPPPPVHAVLQVVRVQIPQAPPAVAIAAPERVRAVDSPRSTRASLRVEPSPRSELEAALAQRPGQPDGINLDPSERSARVVYADRVEYWAMRDGHWQPLGE